MRKFSIRLEETDSEEKTCYEYSIEAKGKGDVPLELASLFDRCICGLGYDGIALDTACEMMFLNEGTLMEPSNRKLWNALKDYDKRKKHD